MRREADTKNKNGTKNNITTSVNNSLITSSIYLFYYLLL